MSRNRLIVSVSGYGATGSSVVTDFLKGIEEVDVLDDFEFQLHYLPDGISDLDYKLSESCSRFYDSDVAVLRFLDLCKHLESWYEPAFHGELLSIAQDYVNDISHVSWQGYWAWDRLFTPQSHIENCELYNVKVTRINNRRRWINKVLRRLRIPLLQYETPMSYKDYFSKRDMYYAIKPDDFLEKTREFSERLIDKAKHKESNFVVVNQLLPPNNPIRFYKYFSSNIKSVVVNRDPRDLYLHVKYHKWQVIPYEDVNVFINWYKVTMSSVIRDESVLSINFEDMIYHFEDTKQTLLNFLGIDLNVNCLSSSFDPHVSVANTKLFKKFPEYLADIRQIEKELPEYLYDFSSCEEISCISNKIF